MGLDDDDGCHGDKDRDNEKDKAKKEVEEGDRDMKDHIETVHKYDMSYFGQWPDKSLIWASMMMLQMIVMETKIKTLKNTKI